MRTRTVLTGVLGLALVGLAAPSSAAPDRSAQLTRGTTSYSWTGKTATGVVYMSTVSEQLPACTSPAFSCDQTLLELTAPGRLTVGIEGIGLQGQDTMKDLDLAVYASDTSGTQGKLLGESTGPAASESVSMSKLKPGHYLVHVDWYFGAGSYAGAADLVPDPLPPA